LAFDEGRPLTTGSALEVFAAFARLGLTAFGGPIAHLAYFRAEFVEKRKWLSEAEYADLVALCQFLPGPASSQTGFLLGLRRAGPLGALAAWTAFTLPSALIMLAVAFGVAWFESEMGRALAHGLKLVALAVVAHAVFGMARTLLRGAPTWALAFAAFVSLLLMPVAWTQVVVIAMSAALGFAFLPRSAGAAAASARIGKTPAVLFALFAALLVGLPFVAETEPAAAAAAAFYKAGALVFGGGHVVLPLLEAETVARGWLSEEQFLAGYGAAQALPGPLFTFAAFLGAAGSQTPNGWLGGAVALVFVFLPGLLLAAGAYPYWQALKARPRAAGLIAGANAAVVGVLAAALYDPVFTSAVRGELAGGLADLALAAFGFAALQWLKAPNWAVVLGLSMVGALAFVGL
jgi:chromate transporter